MALDSSSWLLSCPSDLYGSTELSLSVLTFSLASSLWSVTLFLPKYGNKTWPYCSCLDWIPCPSVFLYSSLSQFLSLFSLVHLCWGVCHHCSHFFCLLVSKAPWRQISHCAHPRHGILDIQHWSAVFLLDVKIKMQPTWTSKCCLSLWILGI